MATTTQKQQPPPQAGPIAQQLVKLQSNGQQVPSSQPNTQQPPGKKSKWGFAGKTVWDWLNLFATLAIPLVVVGATIAFGIIQADLAQKQHDSERGNLIRRRWYRILTKHNMRSIGRWGRRCRSKQEQHLRPLLHALSPIPCNIAGQGRRQHHQEKKDGFEGSQTLLISIGEKVSFDCLLALLEEILKSLRMSL
jgi:hypothetical protein